MMFLKWFLQNFGLFFGTLFMVYLFMIIRRLTVLWDYLRHVPGTESGTVSDQASSKALDFLFPLFKRIENRAGKSDAFCQAAADAVWAEIDCRIMVHFQALSGYVSTMVLLGFAGTIFGAIGAFNQMFRGIAAGMDAALVFAESWNHGLSTALYTSLGAAAVGGVVLSLIGSRLLLTRARRLEAMAGQRICDILGEEN